MSLHHVRYQYGSAASKAKPGLTYDKYVQVQTIRVGPPQHAAGAGVYKVQKISPDCTVLGSALGLALPCWTQIRVCALPDGDMSVHFQVVMHGNHPYKRKMCARRPTVATVTTM